MLITKQNFFRGKKIKIDHFIRDFYLKNQNFLQECYPGITLNRLQSEFNFYRLTTYNTSSFFKKLSEGTPLEYITGYKFFYNLSVYVDKRVLIPRFDSEPMIFDIIETYKNKKEDTFLCEVGAGSGALTLSLCKEVQNIKEVDLIDISEEALEVLRINLFRHQNLKVKMNTFCTDRLKGIKNTYDLIVSNPPYISTEDEKLVHTSVKKFEPNIALFIPQEDYLNWFLEFFKEVSEHLNSEGMFFMEGHESKLEELAKCARSFFTSVEVKNDLRGVPRYLKIKK